MKHLFQSPETKFARRSSLDEAAADSSTAGRRSRPANDIRTRQARRFNLRRVGGRAAVLRGLRPSSGGTPRRHGRSRERAGNALRRVSGPSRGGRRRIRRRSWPRTGSRSRRHGISWRGCYHPMARMRTPTRSQVPRAGSATRRPGSTLHSSPAPMPERMGRSRRRAAGRPGVHRLGRRLSRRPLAGGLDRGRERPRPTDTRPPSLLPWSERIEHARPRLGPFKGWSRC